MPLPSEDTTPPVTQINLVIGSHRRRVRTTGRQFSRNAVSVPAPRQSRCDRSASASVSTGRSRQQTSHESSPSRAAYSAPHGEIARRRPALRLRTGAARGRAARAGRRVPGAICAAACDARPAPDGSARRHGAGGARAAPAGETRLRPTADRGPELETPAHRRASHPRTVMRRRLGDGRRTRPARHTAGPGNDRHAHSCQRAQGTRSSAARHRSRRKAARVRTDGSGRSWPASHARSTARCRGSGSARERSDRQGQSLADPGEVGFGEDRRELHGLCGQSGRLADRARRLRPARTHGGQHRMTQVVAIERQVEIRRILDPVEPRRRLPSDAANHA